VFAGLDRLAELLGTLEPTPLATPPHAPATAFVGGSREARAAAVLDYLRQVFASTPQLSVALVEDVGAWPFERHVGVGLPDSGTLVVWARNLHEAFPAGQSGSTRLVLTQSTYQLQRWIDWIDRRGAVVFVADADAIALRRVAPEAFAGRGPWSRIQSIDLGERSKRSDSSERLELADSLDGLNDQELLRIGFRAPDAEVRLGACRRAAESRPDDAIVQLALGSAHMEAQDFGASRQAIEQAITIDPTWEACHFEYGKLWLRLDDMQRACDAFREAGRLMPSFSTAFSNLGATLGELDRPEEGLQALTQALDHDPNGYTIINNIGVVSRELGRLAESEAAFRKVTALAPEFVFGHYNLGHTLFLQGRYQASLAAYTEGQRRDPEKNARQACRLAVVRLAAGDADGARRDLQRYTAGLPIEAKREILGEAQEIISALLTAEPKLAGWRDIADMVKAEIAALESA
jgi:tetratricopeptide (TPR) repeat protein